jgi:hypothetical protein
MFDNGKYDDLLNEFSDKFEKKNYLHIVELKLSVFQISIIYVI